MIEMPQTVDLLLSGTVGCLNRSLECSFYLLMVLYYMYVCNFFLGTWKFSCFYSWCRPTGAVFINKNLILIILSANKVQCIMVFT